MLLYLIRHAHAVDGDEDAVRPLSRRGRGQIRGVGAFLRRGRALVARECWHSPLVRAHETARLFVPWLGTGIKLRKAAGLLPEDDPGLMARRLEKRRGSVALVGHEPHLSALATLLLTGGGGESVVRLKKCAILALERTRGRWAVRWLISPDLFSRGC